LVLIVDMFLVFSILIFLKIQRGIDVWLSSHYRRLIFLAGISYLHYSIRIDSGSQPASCPVSTGALSPGVILTSSAEVKIVWS
jgi:hypothetical protein